jgi:hypothetical protein
MLEIFSSSCPAGLGAGPRSARLVKESEDVEQQDDAERDVKKPKNEAAGHGWNSQVVATG